MSTTVGQKYLYFILVIATLAIIAWLFFVKGCGHPAPAVNTDKHIADSVLAVVRSRDSVIYLLQDDTATLRADTAGTNHELAFWQHKAQLDAAARITFANNVVTAHKANDSAGFIVNCDSLAAATIRNQYMDDSLKRVTRSALDARDDLARNRSQLIAQMQAQNQGYSSAVASLQKQIKDNTPQPPKIKGYGGAEIIVAPNVIGFGVGGMLQDKQERFYRGSVGVCTTSGLYVGIGYYRLIKL